MRRGQHNNLRALARSTWQDRFRKKDQTCLENLGVCCLRRMAGTAFVMMLAGVHYPVEQTKLEKQRKLVVPHLGSTQEEAGQEFHFRIPEHLPSRCGDSRPGSEASSVQSVSR